MPVPHSTLLPLLQLADSCLPVGGFAFSSGLESWVRLGILRGEDCFRVYLRGVLGQLRSSDLPFLHSMYRCEGWSSAQLPGLATAWEAFNPASSFRKASRTLGRNWLRVLRSLHPEGDWSAAEAAYRNESATSHFVVAFAQSLRGLGVPVEQAGILYLYMALRDQTSAAIRLGIAGPMRAQELLASLWQAMEAAAAEAPRDYRSAAKTAPVLDLGQLSQPHLYSRLFQN